MCRTILCQSLHPYGDDRSKSRMAGEIILSGLGDIMASEVGTEIVWVPTYLCQCLEVIVHRDAHRTWGSDVQKCIAVGCAGILPVELIKEVFAVHVVSKTPSKLWCVTHTQVNDAVARHTGNAIARS